jgi:hypothetical protein
MKKMFLLPILSLAAIASAANGYAIFGYSATNTTTSTQGANSVSGWGTDIFVEVHNGATFQNPTNPFYTTAKLAVDEGVIKLKGVVLGPLTTYPGASIGIKNGTGTKKITDCTGGISYWYKGDEHWFNLEFDYKVCDGSATSSDGSNKWGKKIAPASTSWKKETVAISSLPLGNTWDGAKCTATTVPSVQLDKVDQVLWGFDDKQTGTNLMIGDIVCLGGSDDYTDKEPASSVAINTGCFGDSPCGPTPSSASGGTPSSSSGGDTPIISHNSAPVTGLNVVSFARSIKIASGKDATVSLFDMNGRQVLSQRVFSGTTTISLANQKQGVYYAVVKSDSHKQTVKVVLK